MATKAEGALARAVVEYVEAEAARAGSVEAAEAAATLRRVLAPAGSAAGPSLAEVWAAGLDKLGVKLEEEDGAAGGKREVDPVTQSSKFAKYLDMVTKKGYFKGVEEATAEYQERFDKLVAKFKEKFDAGAEGAAAAAAPAAAASAEVAAADEFKAEGNKLLAAEKYEEAAASYTKAIEACDSNPNMHIYYCNRAAAYLHLGRDEEALEDCSVASTLAPDYAKAHVRAAQANQRLGRNDDALASANRALELDPNNAVASAVTKSLGGATAAVPGGMPGGMPGGLGGLDPAMIQQAMAGLGGMGGGGGGMPDIASMMQNPQMMQAAQQMMQNPQMMEAAQKMMQDPNALANMMGMFGGGGPK